MNLSPDRTAVAGPTYEQARFHARELGLLGAPDVVLVSLSGHPGSIAGMKFKKVIRVGGPTYPGDAKAEEMVEFVKRCQAAYERSRASTPETS